MSDNPQQLGYQLSKPKKDKSSTDISLLNKHEQDIKKIESSLKEQIKFDKGEKWRHF